MTDEAPTAAPPPAAPATARPKGWLLGYPTDHLMGILPSPAAADAAIAELERAGIDPGAILVLVGEEAALRIDGRGTHHGVVARLYRLLQFTQMDPARRDDVRAVLRANGAHFTNFYGRLFTETLDPYAGPDEGDLPI